MNSRIHVSELATFRHFSLPIFILARKKKKNRKPESERGEEGREENEGKIRNIYITVFGGKKFFI